MSFFKCKMCGGTVEFEPGASVGVCDSCGTKQTLPRLDDDKRANLYDRANHFRRNNDFDKAMSIYEQILNEDTTDAEAYWSIVLCRYGVEYVEDPATGTRVPTVNRAQFTSIYSDEDYKSALQYADGYQREIYEAEAKAIDDIQKGILAISSKEKPFDVFICYKETDASGNRTKDSVLATDLYHQLTQEGFKVFFARITLEDKLGAAYEPYIFAALNSAKVMVVLGTKPEYFSAVWVKNEWSRYLALVKASKGKKTLIPAYKDMDPYDLPEEFSHLQAQDMSKLGFMQDLIRGIKKLAASDAPAAGVIKEGTATAGVSGLLKRIELFLEDEDWKSAITYCEKVLDVDPENSKVYLLRLMAQRHIRSEKEMADYSFRIDNDVDYQKALRFADPTTAEKLKKYEETARKNFIYDSAIGETLKRTVEGFEKAVEKLKQIPGWKDVDRQIDICKEEIKTLSYNEGMKCKLRGDYALAIGYFKRIPGWKDADEQILECGTKQKEEIYQKGLQAKEEGDYLLAIDFFRQIPDWKDASDQSEECDAKRKNGIYEQALQEKKAKNYDQAKTLFSEISGWKDADSQFYDCDVLYKDDLYNEAIKTIKKKPTLINDSIKCELLMEGISKFKEIPDWENWRDTKSCVAKAYQTINDTTLKAINEAKKLGKSNKAGDVACAIYQLEKAESMLEYLSEWKDQRTLINECIAITKKLQPKLKKRKAIEEKREVRKNNFVLFVKRLIIILLCIYSVFVIFNEATNVVVETHFWRWLYVPAGVLALIILGFIVSSAFEENEYGGGIVLMIGLLVIYAGLAMIGSLGDESGMGAHAGRLFYRGFIFDTPLMEKLFQALGWK